MEIYGDFEQIKKINTVGSGIGLGNFDGVHLGHCSLIETLQKKSKEMGITSIVYTFSNHPNKVLFKDRATPIIMTREQKNQIFREKNVDAVYYEHFDEEYANMPAADFIKNYLVEKFNAKLIVVGHNYSFGCKGKGTPQMLKEYGEQYGFDVIIVPPVMHDGEIISSTRLRKLIADGDMIGCYNLTGRNYSIPGVVAVGRRVGHELGFPTANILPRDGFALPKEGVYATRTLIDGVIYNGVTNIGNNPTFQGIKKITVETHLFDYNSELYGKNIEVFFIEMLRSEHRFESVEALKKQMNCDVLNAKKILGHR